MVSIRNVEDSLKGIAVFKITTKLQINCIIYSVRIVHTMNMGRKGKKSYHKEEGIQEKMIVQLIDDVDKKTYLVVFHAF